MPKFIYDTEEEDDEYVKPMTWLAKRHNEIVRERFEQTEDEEEEE